MASETLRTASTAAPGQDSPAKGQPRVAASVVLVVSRDPLERQAMVGALGGSEALEVVSAAGFHMAVPMVWSAAPHVIVVGDLSPRDRDRLPELRHHAGEAVVVAVEGDGREYAATHADLVVTSEADLLELLAQVRPAPSD
jgi:hypothetical protein